MEPPDIEEMLGLQVAEVDMLASMYPKAGEFEMDDPLSLIEVQSFLDGEIPYAAVQARIGFILKLQVHDSNGKEIPLELACFLGHEYPSVLPDIMIRCTALDKSEHEKMVSDAIAHLETLERGEICIGPLIEWIKENSHNYLSDEPTKKCKTAPAKKHDNKFTRLWIYSHHLYSKIKRKDILDFSAELRLTGFSMCGKPGIICVEGASDDVEEFWRRIRSMQWKKITMKEKEDEQLLPGSDLDSLRRFEGFLEKGFDAKAGHGRNVLQDLGLLYQYLQEHNCAYIYPMYFGVEGKTADD